jgi:hypothetical protein
MLVETRKPEETGSTIEIELVQTHPVGSYGLVLWVEGDGLIHSGMVLDYGPGGREAGSRPVVGGARWWRDAGGGLTWSEFEGTLAKFGGYDGTVEDLIQGVLEPGFYPLMMAPKYSAHSG